MYLVYREHTFNIIVMMTRVCAQNKLLYIKPTVSILVATANST